MQMAPNESDPRAQSRQPQVAAEVNSEDHKSGEMRLHHVRADDLIN